MKQILVRLTDGHGLKLLALKNAYGISYNQLVRFAVAYLIEHHPQIAKAYPFMQKTQK